MIPAMSFDQRQQLFREDDDMLDGTKTDTLNTAPPGEEGVYMSHAGGLDDVFHEVLDEFQPSKYFRSIFIFSHILTLGASSPRADLRSRRDRIQIQTAQWRIQMDPLIKAYMIWNSEGPLPVDA